VSSTAASGAGAASGASSFDIVTTAPGRFSVRGTITFANARAARNAGLQALRAASGHDLEIDCAGITHSDSAGLAVMLDWMAIMKHDGRPLRFANLPQGLLAVASISGVEEMLQKGV
jgi:phospholipid transport system transporter-binding protein